MDTPTFTKLYEDTYGRVLAYCCKRCLPDRSEAEDCTAETFERAYTHLAQLKSDDELGARSWLFTIARNVIASHQRRRHEFIGINEKEQDRRTSADPEASALMQEDIATLGAELRKLPARQREALYLSAIVGMSRDEIAQIMATSEINVRVMSWRAHQRLLAALT